MLTKQHLPLFKSDIQGRLLATLILHPHEERTISELVREVGTYISTVKAETDPLIATGFLISRVSGRNRYLRANVHHPLFQPMYDILLYAYGPAAILPDLLKDLPGLEEAWIFGSWARRYEGEHFGAVGDLDVLLIGENLRNSIVHDTAFDAGKALRIETNFVKMTRAAFESGEDPFARTVRESARVQVDLQAARG